MSTTGNTRLAFRSTMARSRNLVFVAALALTAGNAGGADIKGAASPATAVFAAKIAEWPVPTPLGPRDPVPDAEGNIYFSVARGDKIARFDTKSKLFKEWMLPAGTKPHGLAVASNGKVFFAANGNGTIGELDPRTGAVVLHKTSDPAGEPYSILLDDKGSVWATLRKAGKVVKLDRATKAVSEYPVEGGPYGLAFDLRGVLWVSRLDADKLTSLDPKTGKTIELYTGAGSKPRRLAVGRDGTLWVSLYGTGRIVNVATAANTIVKEYELPGGQNAGPYAVNVDASGRVWVLEHQTDSVVIFDPKSESFQVIRLPGKNLGVRNAAIDPKGRYWFVGSTAGKLGAIE